MTAGGTCSLAAGRVVGPILGQIEPAVHQGVTGLRGVGQEDTDLAVVDLTQPAAPLSADAAGLSTLLGEAAGVDDHHALGLGQRLADVLPQFGRHSFVVPAAGADEELDRLPGPPASMAIGPQVLRSSPLSARE